MQPQNNDFPLDKIASQQPTGAVPAGDTGSTDPVAGPPSGGATFSPQQNPVSQGSQPVPAPETPTTPTNSFQQTAQSDAEQLYAQTGQPTATNPGSTTQMPETPPAAAMQQDFEAAQNITTPTPPPSTDMPPEIPLADTPQSAPTSPEPPQPTSSSPQPNSTLQSGSTVPPANTLDLSDLPGGAPPADYPGMEPISPASQPPVTSAATTPPPPAEQPNPGSLPGAEQLSAASAGLDTGQSSAPNPAMDPTLVGMDEAGSYGPPPSNRKKIILIILGVGVGIVILIILVLVLTRSNAKKPAVNLSQTQQTNQTQQTQQPTSGPATPPAGFVTIEKQCYTFAMYEKNTIPADQVCSFSNATFGKLGVSKFSVATGTDTYNSLDDFVGKVKPTLSVTNDEPIKLDGFDARKITYKGSDGKTYVKVLTLVNGKNYQQDGKKVTSAEITSSYQEDFDKQVADTAISTWRWK